MLRRRVVWLTSGTHWAAHRGTEPLPHVVVTHSSPLLRQLGDSQMWLQHNKVTNLRIASPRLDGLLLRPGETFSFCRTVGNATSRRGYVFGMTLDGGDVRPGVGGGLCQIANLLHWMALHTDLTVVQRSEHTVDPFPDSGRTVPWGTGCSIAWNYVDLQLRNDTGTTYALRVRVGERDLEGAIETSDPELQQWRVEARDERFEQSDGMWWRSNEIWRVALDPVSGEPLGREELVKRNRARTLYVPDLGPGGVG